MTPKHFELKVFCDGVRVRDESGEYRPPEQVRARSPCGLDSQICQLHREEHHSQSPLPGHLQVSRKSWTTRLKAKAQRAVSIFLPRRDKTKQNIDLAVILNDFRYPVIKVTKQFSRNVSPCCLLLEANIYWCDNETAKIWGYLQKICDFMGALAVKGTVAVDIRFKFYLDGGQALNNAGSYLLSALEPAAFRSTDIKHIDFTICVEQLGPHTIKIYRFKGSREDTSAEFQGQISYNVMNTGVIADINQNGIQFVG